MFKIHTQSSFMTGSARIEHICKSPVINLTRECTECVCFTQFLSCKITGSWLNQLKIFKRSTNFCDFKNFRRGFKCDYSIRYAYPLHNQLIATHVHIQQITTTFSCNWLLIVVYLMCANSNK